MKCGTVSSATLFNPTINPGMRLDVPFALSLGAIEQGRIDKLRECFDHLFTRQSYAVDWQNKFRKCKTWEEAENHLLWAYGIKGSDKEKLPAKFREGLRSLVRILITESLERLTAEEKNIQTQVEEMKTILQESK